MTTRHQAILELTVYELQYLIDNPELLDDVSEFFTNGGFSALSDEKLQEHYQFRKIEATQ